jgi:serine/threonine protein kinase
VDREVAIKAILPEFANQPEFIRSFEAEAQLVARLEHPHIVPLYDYWREPDGAYLVMRYLRGGNLTDLLKNGPMALDRISYILDQVTMALLVAHRNKVVHRDIKPDNVLLDEEGNVYLTDFGIAKAVGYQTTDQNVSGSLRYMAPEQLASQPPTPAVDIYSLGLVIYEMVTGTHPFEGATATERVATSASARASRTAA